MEPDADLLTTLDDVRGIVGESPPRQKVSFGRQVAPRLGGGEELARRIDDAVEADYRDNL